jgi:hypothetical protein
MNQSERPGHLDCTSKVIRKSINKRSRGTHFLKGERILAMKNKEPGKSDEEIEEYRNGHWR